MREIETAVGQPTAAHATVQPLVQLAEQDGGALGHGFLASAAMDRLSPPFPSLMEHQASSAS